MLISSCPGRSDLSQRFQSVCLSALSCLCCDYQLLFLHEMFSVVCVRGEGALRVLRGLSSSMEFVRKEGYGSRIWELSAGTQFPRSSMY